MNLLGFGKESMPTVLKDPFGKRNVTRIYVSMSQSLFNDTFSANGSVEFKNGDTHGEQKFNGDTFDDVVLKIQAFLKNELK